MQIFKGDCFHNGRQTKINIKAGLRSVFLLALGVNCIALVTTVIAQEKSAADKILDREFRDMMAWFPGQYNNQEQVYFEGNLDIPENERHEHIHHIFYPIKLKNFPGTTFYIQQSQSEDLNDIYRQRIYSFEPDYAENAIRLTIYTPKNPEALVDAHLDPSKLNELTIDDMILRPGCEVYWRKQAAQFIGTMKENACSFQSQRSGKTIFINDNLVLSEQAIWINDQAVDRDGNRVFGNINNIPHKNHKAREFTCWVSVKKKIGEDSWSFDSGLKVHDQGGWAWVTTDEDEPQKVGIKIRNVDWPTGYNRDSLVLYAYREGSDRAVSYAWTSPDGTRIALNLRWMQASCTLSDPQPF